MLREKYFQYKDYSYPNVLEPIGLEYPTKQEIEKYQKQLEEQESSKQYYIPEDDNEIKQIDSMYRNLKTQIRQYLEQVDGLQENIVQKDRKIMLQESEFEELMLLFQLNDQEIEKKEAIQNEIQNIVNDIDMMEQRKNELEVLIKQQENQLDLKRLKKEIFKPEQMTNEDILLLRDGIKKIEGISGVNQEIIQYFEEFGKEFFEQILTPQNNGRLSSFNNNVNNNSTDFSTVYQEYEELQNEIKQEFEEQVKDIEKKQQIECGLIQKSIDQLKKSNRDLEQNIKDQNHYMQERLKVFNDLQKQVQDNNERKKNLRWQIDELQKEIRNCQ